MADTYIVTIEGAPSGTWTQVKSILESVEWDYEKPEFIFPADDALLDRVLAVEGVELVVGKPEPEPEPEKKAAPVWSVVAGDAVLKVRCHEQPPAELLAQRLGVSACCIEDASGDVVVRWP